MRQRCPEAGLNENRARFTPTIFSVAVASAEHLARARSPLSEVPRGTEGNRIGRAALLTATQPLFTARRIMKRPAPLSQITEGAQMIEVWKPISTAPTDGKRFVGRKTEVCRYTGKLKYIRRWTWWGKVSHVPLFGWVHGRVENVDLWEPTHWRDGSVPG